MSDIEDCIRDILIEDLFVELAKDQILATASLRDEIGLDSLGFVELKTRVEKRFGIVIPDEDFTPETFSTLSSITRMIIRYRGDAMPEAAHPGLELAQR